MIGAPFWRVLGIAPTTDESAVRKAYAAKVRLANPEDDPEAFKALRAAYDAALQYARWRSRVEAYEANGRDEEYYGDDDGDEFDPSIADAPPRFASEASRTSQEVHRTRDDVEDVRWIDPSAADAPPRSGSDASRTSQEARRARDDAEDVRWMDPSIVGPPPLSSPEASSASHEAAPEREDADAARWIDPVDAARNLQRKLIAEHAHACDRLMRELAAGAPHERVLAALEAVLRSEAMAQVDVYARTQDWLVRLLHNARPHSDVLVDRVIEFFKWKDTRALAWEWSGAEAVLALRARIALERERDAFLERVADPRHEFHRAWREMGADARARRKGFAQVLSLRWLMRAERFLAHVDAKMPSALEKLDGFMVGWWRSRVLRFRPWFFAVRALILFVACSFAMSTLSRPPEPSAFDRLRAAAYATTADHAAARELCKLAAQQTPSLAKQRAAGITPSRRGLEAARDDCRYARGLMQDSLLIRQYQGILELKIDNMNGAVNYFDAILAVSPLDSAALFGKGLALRSRESSRTEAADLDLMGKALRLDPDVANYFASFGLDAFTYLTPAGEAPPFVARPAPDFDTPPVRSGPPVSITPAQNNTLDAYRRLGFQPFIEGRVELECLVTALGELTECRIVRETPANRGLGELAIALSPGVLYTPARLAGAPVDRFPERIPFTFAAASVGELVPPSPPPAPPVENAHEPASSTYLRDLSADPAELLECYARTGEPC